MGTKDTFKSTNKLVACLDNCFVGGKGHGEISVEINEGNISLGEQGGIGEDLKDFWEPTENPGCI